MKHILSLIFIIVTTVSYSHEYYFSFTEMEYNDITKKFEITINVSTHDLEMVYEKYAEIHLNLNNYKADSETTEHLKGYFEAHFILSTEIERCKLNLIGFETSLNGTTNFYFESSEIDITPTLKLMNDILMDQYPQQQNKITLYRQSKSYTYDFLSNERLKTITLN